MTTRRPVRRTLWIYVAGAAAVAVGGMTSMAAPASAVSDATATPTDGCGRVDSVSIQGGDGLYRVLVVGQTMPNPSNPRSPIPASYEVAVTGGSGTWTRTSDAIDDKATKGLAFRVVDPNGEYVKIAAPDRQGTDTFTMTNEDCVVPAEPTFDDQPGTTNDTVTIPVVNGVTYNFKPGTTVVKGTVTVTATAAKGFRLAKDDGTPLEPTETRWTSTMDASRSVSIPESALPVFRLGEPVDTSKKGSKPNPNVIVLTAVPGVTWFVDGKAVKADGKTPFVEAPIGTKKSATVIAAGTDANTTIDGQSSWNVTEASIMPLPTLPRVFAPSDQTGVKPGKALVQWAPPYLTADRYTFDVQWRPAPGRDAYGNELRSDWRPWFAGTTQRSATLNGPAGGVFQVRVSGRTKGNVATAWAAPVTVVIPLDVTSGPRGWAKTRDTSAIGGTLVSTTRAGAAWQVRTAPTATVMVWAATGPVGSRMRIYVDGRLRGTANTWTPGVRPRTLVAAIPVSWGKHTVRLVNLPNGKRNLLRLDAVAYAR